MKTRIRLITKFRYYLSYQIFVTFWVVVSLFTALALVVPSFDARVFHNLELQERHQFERETMNARKQFNLDEIFERRLIVTTTTGFDVILLERQTGIFVGFEKEQAKELQAFIYRASDHTQPLKRRFNDLEIIGPFITYSDKREFLQYFTRKVEAQQAIFDFIFDSPWLIFFILLVSSTPILLWFSHKLAEPVKQLRLSANAVAMGNLTINPKLESEGIIELREVGKSFNQMIKSLQNLIQYQQRMLSDISHELKTPLARLQLASALLRRRNGESSEIIRIENEIQKLNTMVYDLLSLSRQQLNQHLTREVFPIQCIWENVIIDAKFETEQNGLQLSISQSIAYPERYFINGNANILASALENLIRNAQKYAKQNIKVQFYVENNLLTIGVDDDGIGVSESEYEQIFRPFYRVDEARTRETGGTGLGLAIVENAIQQHKGSVKAMKSVMGGLRVEIKLPLWIEE